MTGTLLVFTERGVKAKDQKSSVTVTVLQCSGRAKYINTHSIISVIIKDLWPFRDEGEWWVSFVTSTFIIGDDFAMRRSFSLSQLP